MAILWWRKPDLILHPAGKSTWEIRVASPTGKHWLAMETGNGDTVLLPHDTAVELVFRAIRDGLVVCSDPGKRP